MIPHDKEIPLLLLTKFENGFGRRMDGRGDNISIGVHWVSFSSGMLLFLTRLTGYLTLSSEHPLKFLFPENATELWEGPSEFDFQSTDRSEATHLLTKFLVPNSTSVAADCYPNFDLVPLADPEHVSW